MVNPAPIPACKTLRRWLPAIVAVLVGLCGPALAQQADQPAQTVADPAASLLVKRNATAGQLRELARAIAESADKTKALEDSIASIAKTSDGLRQAILESAARRRDLERKLAGTESRLAELMGREAKAKTSLHERRGVLAEVLAALQRMGRNPPPALLVSPDDALSSVRSAILLGAVVPGIRGETEKLAADLGELADVRKQAQTEKESFVADMAASLEEERRMNRLIAENQKLGTENAKTLEAERKRAAELASQATSLQGLIVSLERDIDSSRKAAEAARAEMLRRQGLSPEEREKARQLAEQGVPDKNRIAPAYAFSDLKARIELPVAGALVRLFGDDDGTGHPAQGVTVETGPGSLVSAPADGWIVFAGPFRSYGQMVILNLGDGFHMVMTGMDQVVARQGQFVVAGEPLGQMGEKRVASATALALETERPILYIELRKDGKPVDSKPWWLVKDLGKARNDT